MDARIITGGVFLLGSLGFFLRGLQKAYEESEATPEVEVFSWSKALFTIIPGLVAAFLAGYNISPGGTVEWVSLLVSGWGFSAIAHEGDKMLGVRDFFSCEVR